MLKNLNNRSRNAALNSISFALRALAAACVQVPVGVFFSLCTISIVYYVVALFAAK